MPAPDDPGEHEPGTERPGTGGPDDPGGWDRPGRSVFDEPAPAAPEPGAGDADRDDVTDVFPAVEGRRPPRPGRAVLDGAAFGVYEEDEGRSRTAMVIGGLLAVAALAVGALVWRAVNTDARLDLPDESSTTTARPATDEPPTVEALRALIPSGLDTCVPFGEPDDQPPRVTVLCPRSGVPQGLGFVLYSSLADREAEFDRLVGELGIPTSGTDCALGQNGAHDYIGVERVGRVACFSNDEVVDFVWTTDEAPLLGRARGAGAFSDHYAFWDRIVDRTDARFPLPSERALVGRLPDGLSADCRRDLDLNVATGGLAAVACEADGVSPDLVSSVQFRDQDSMSAWLEFTRASLTSSVFGEGDDACTSTGFGRRPDPPTTTTTTTPTEGEAPPETTSPPTTQPPPPAPDAGFTPYDLGGRTGRVLCFVNSSDTNVLFWVRQESLIGSIAISDRRTGATMRELLEWWESGGHRP